MRYVFESNINESVHTIPLVEALRKLSEDNEIKSVIDNCNDCSGFIYDNIYISVEGALKIYNAYLEIEEFISNKYMDSIQNLMKTLNLKCRYPDVELDISFTSFFKQFLSEEVNKENDH